MLPCTAEDVLAAKAGELECIYQPVICLDSNWAPLFEHGKPLGAFACRIPLKDAVSNCTKDQNEDRWGFETTLPGGEEIILRVGYAAEYGWAFNISGRVIRTTESELAEGTFLTCEVLQFTSIDELNGRSSCKGEIAEHKQLWSEFQLGANSKETSAFVAAANLSSTRRKALFGASTPTSKGFPNDYGCIWVGSSSSWSSLQNVTMIEQLETHAQELGDLDVLDTLAPGDEGRYLTLLVGISVLPPWMAPYFASNWDNGELATIDDSDIPDHLDKFCILELETSCDM